LLLLEFLLPLMAGAGGAWIIIAPSWRRCGRNLRFDLFFGHQATPWFSVSTFIDGLVASASTEWTAAPGLLARWSAAGSGTWYARTGLPQLAAYLMLRWLPASRRRPGLEEPFPK
jgi:hypothetical protein